MNQHRGDIVPGGAVLQGDTYPNLLPCNIATSFSIPNRFQRVWFWFAVYQMENLLRTHVSITPQARQDVISPSILASGFGGKQAFNGQIVKNYTSTPMVQTPLCLN